MGSKFQLRAYQSFYATSFRRWNPLRGRRAEGTFSYRRIVLKHVFLFFFKSDHVLFLIYMNSDVY